MIYINAEDNVSFINSDDFIWHEDQYCRELIELVINDHKENEEVLALADDRKRKLSKHYSEKWT